MVQPTRLILFLSLVVVAASIGLVVLVFTDRETSPEVGADPVEDTASAQVDDDTQGSVAADSAGSVAADSAGSVAADSAGLPGDVLAAADDPVAAAVTEACRQFRTGSTPAEVAVWFESNWVETDADMREVFREVIETALTRTCPEVLPPD